MDEEQLAIFDLLKKPELRPHQSERVKEVAAELLKRLKAEKLRVDRWREREATRAAVKVEVRDFLWTDETGPPSVYSEPEVDSRADDVFRHLYRAYPTVPSPYYMSPAA